MRMATDGYRCHSSLVFSAAFLASRTFGNSPMGCCFRDKRYCTGSGTAAHCGDVGLRDGNVRIMYRCARRRLVTAAACDESLHRTTMSWEPTKGGSDGTARQSEGSTVEECRQGGHGDR